MHQQEVAPRYLDSCQTPPPTKISLRQHRFASSMLLWLPLTTAERPEDVRRQRDEEQDLCVTHLSLLLMVRLLLLLHHLTPLVKDVWHNHWFSFLPDPAPLYALSLSFLKANFL